MDQCKSDASHSNWTPISEEPDNVLGIVTTLENGCCINDGGCACNDPINHSDDGRAAALWMRLGDPNLPDDHMYDTSSDEGGSSAVMGEDGAEEHQLIDVEHYGPISLAAIYRALARINYRIIVHDPFEEYQSSLSPSASGIWSSSSMAVEHDSSEQSMVSSQVLSMRTPSPAMITFMGGPFEFEQQVDGLQGSLFNAHGPIRLTPEILMPVLEETETAGEGSHFGD